MATIKTHCEDCIQVLGKPFQQVHEYLDQYSKKYDPRLYFERHRMYLHHDKGVQEIISKFGFYSGQAAKLHLIRDNAMYVIFDIKTMREDDIERLYQQALKFCHKPEDIERMNQRCG